MHTIVLLTITILCSISTCGVHTIVDKSKHLPKKIILIKNMIRQKNLERKFEFPDRYRNQRKKEREKLRLSRARLRLPTILYCASKVKFLDVCVCVCVYVFCISCLFFKSSDWVIYSLLVVVLPPRSAYPTRIFELG